MDRRLRAARWIALDGHSVPLCQQTIDDWLRQSPTAQDFVRIVAGDAGGLWDSGRRAAESWSRGRLDHIIDRDERAPSDVVRVGRRFVPVEHRRDAGIVAAK